MTLPYMQLKPARARHRKTEKLWNDPTWIAEEKFDGWRGLLHFGGDCDRPYLTGRNPSTVTGLFLERAESLPEIWPLFAQKWGYTVLDCEIIPSEEGGFFDMAGLMNADHLKIRKKISEVGPPRLVAFDVLFCDGVDVRDQMLVKRRPELLRIFSEVQTQRMSTSVWYEGEDKRRAFEEITEAGGEGIMLKDISCSYGDGWVKVKKVRTLDVVLTGFTEANFGKTGKFYGQIGSAIVSVYTSSGNMVEVGKVSGMNDVTRLDMTQNPNNWLGQVVEVCCDGWAKDRLWHPRFKRLRPDSHPHSCTWAKMMEDLGLTEEGTKKNTSQLELF